MLPSRYENAADAVISTPHSCLINLCPTHCSPAHANVCPIRMHRLILGLSTLTNLHFTLTQKHHQTPTLHRPPPRTYTHHHAPPPGRPPPLHTPTTPLAPLHSTGPRPEASSEEPASTALTTNITLCRREFVCLPWSEVCSARVTSLLLLLLL